MQEFRERFAFHLRLHRYSVIMINEREHWNALWSSKLPNDVSWYQADAVA